MRLRAWVWVQIAIAWLPLWALFAAIIVIVHDNPVHDAMLASLRMVVPGALLGFGVYRLATWLPWPYPFRYGFLALHIAAAFAYSFCWLLAVALVDSIVLGQLTLRVGPGIGAFALTGVWLYLVVAGAAYANIAAQRGAQMEANAARMQLEALRAQLQPHFLFNALHTVVQLIPTRPRDAVSAAEQLAGVLRVTIERQRDLVTLAEELDFVERCLAIEAIRYGERLRVERRIDANAHDAQLPSYALHTLVENALHHGAAPRIEPTTIVVAAHGADDELVVSVTDDGAGVDPALLAATQGTGLKRLRERMRWLYGNRAQLVVASAQGRGFVATLRLPQNLAPQDDTDG